MPAASERPAGRRPFWRPGRTGPGALWLILAAIPLIIVAAIAVWLVLDWRQDDAVEVESNVPTTLTRVLDEPEEFYGERVTVSGNIARALTPRAFTLAPRASFGEGALLVITAPNLPPVQAGQPGSAGAQEDLRVTGTLREFRLADVEKEVGADLEDGLFREFEGKPVLLATELFRLTP